MATPSGQIAFSQVNLELGVSPTSSQANLGSAPFRGLAGVPSGQISMSNLQGKSSFSVTSSGTIATPASGLAPGNGYIYHTFTGPGTFTVNGSKTMEILLVAGGGGGGPSFDSTSGGGGAGGLIYWSTMPVTSGTYPVTVGSGGAGGQNNGNPSIFAPGTPLHLVSLGGGYGGGGPRSAMYNGNPGGSGGGGSGFASDTAAGSGVQTTDPTIPANSRTYGFGNPGGQVGSNIADGGGGAGEAGNTDGNYLGGDGRQYPAFTGPLIGVSALNPLAGFYAGGGGGGYQGLGGDGGGGAGGQNANGTPGVTNSGGGGGGSWPFNIGGSGGSGICAIRYLA